MAFGGKTSEKKKITRMTTGGRARNKKRVGWRHLAGAERKKGRSGGGKYGGVYRRYGSGTVGIRSVHPSQVPRGGGKKNVKVTDPAVA